MTKNAKVAVISRAPWLETGGMLILVIALWQLLKYLGFVTLSTRIENSVSLSAVFAVGVIAAMSSCMALVGGLLLSVSAKWTQAHQNQTRAERFRPLFLFNVGRLGGYFILGGMVGTLGKAFTFTPKAAGLLTIGVAITMVFLGLNILQLVPKRYCTIPLPRKLQTRIRELGESQNPLMPALIGALTFFVPCGFTQSMQLLALNTGTFAGGSAIMLVFALGTLPSLLGISVLSSVLEGNAGRFFLKFSGAVVLLLGLSNLSNGGLLFTGVDAKSILGGVFLEEHATQSQTNENYVRIDSQNRQIVTVYVTDQGYAPDSIAIQPGYTTWIEAIAKEPLAGCASFMLVPAFNLSVPIQTGYNFVGPLTGLKSGQTIQFVCSLGILKGALHVR